MKSMSTFTFFEMNPCFKASKSCPSKHPRKIFCAFLNPILRRYLLTSVWWGIARFLRHSANIFGLPPLWLIKWALSNSLVSWMDLPSNSEKKNTFKSASFSYLEFLPFLKRQVREVTSSQNFLKKDSILWFERSDFMPEFLTELGNILPSSIY